MNIGLPRNPEPPMDDDDREACRRLESRDRYPLMYDDAFCKALAAGRTEEAHARAKVVLAGREPRL